MGSNGDSGSCGLTGRKLPFDGHYCTEYLAVYKDYRRFLILWGSGAQIPTSAIPGRRRTITSRRPPGGAGAFALSLIAGISRVFESQKVLVNGPGRLASRAHG